MTLMSEIRVTLKDQISLPSDSSTQKSGEVFFYHYHEFCSMKLRNGKRPGHSP